MKHRINGCLLSLDTLAEEQIDRLLDDNAQRRGHLDSEKELLVKERIRRTVSAIGSLELQAS